MEYEKTALIQIGKFIDEAITERGFNYSTLEKASGVSRTIIYKIVRGENYEIGSLIKVMRYLQIHIEMSLMSAENNIFTMGGNKPSDN
jgi:predicted transcriptional regulator